MKLFFKLFLALGLVLLIGKKLLIFALAWAIVFGLHK